MLITLTNEFHHTNVRVRVTGGKVSHRAGRRAWATLCGTLGCICGGQLGQRGGQSFGGVDLQIEPDFAREGDKRGNYSANIILKGN